jgi:hypothetical protein
MTTGLLAELNGTLIPLLDVGLSYLTLDRSGASLSTGERQRIELTSTGTRDRTSRIAPGTIGANNGFSHDQQRRAEWRSPISGTR